MAIKTLTSACAEKTDRYGRAYKIQHTVAKHTSNRRGVACGPELHGTEWNIAYKCSAQSPRQLPHYRLSTSLRASGFKAAPVAEATVARQSRANRDFNCRGASASAARRYRAPIAAASPARRPSAAARASAAALRRSAEEASNPFCPWLDRPFYIVHVNALRWYPADTRSG